MSETAILVLGNESLFHETWAGPSFASASKEDPPLACLEILGCSLLERTIAGLQSSGVNNIRLLAEDNLARFVPRRLRKNLICVRRPFDAPPALERIIRQESAQGVQTIFVIKVEAYFEFDVADIRRCHHASGNMITSIADTEGPLSMWVVNATAFAQAGISIDAAMRATEASYFIGGYVNRLTGPTDLRRLVTDALARECGLTPRGREIRPGVWIDDGARIHSDARVIAPVYIGRKARIHAFAQVRSFSNIECGSVVACGSTIEQSSVLPRTYIGKELDIADAVVDGHRFLSLRRNVALEITDPSITCKIEPWRLIGLSRKPAGQGVFTGAAAEVRAMKPLTPAPVPAYLNNSKEQYERWETCNRQAVT